jgi:hypothetical protein
VLASTGAVVLAPLALAALAARGRALLLVAAGGAWMVTVALMSEAGFSGEPRYLVPGAALLAVGGAVGWARLAVRAAAGLALAALVAVAALPRLAAVAELGPRLAHQHALASDLRRAIDGAGGRDRVVACGVPAVGPYRGTLLAWHLDVPKRAVRADGRPGDVTFRSHLFPGSAPSPPRDPASRPLAAAGAWRVEASCRGQSRGSSWRSERTGAKRSPSRSTRSRTSSLANTSVAGSPDP